jgi:transcriptional regulator with XRE-family HTH domain
MDTRGSMFSPRAMSLMTDWAQLQALEMAVCVYPASMSVCMTSDHFIGSLSASRDWTARRSNGEPISGMSTLSAMAQKRARTEYGERVYRARTLAKLTQPQLAKAAGMSQGTLGELEYNAHSSRFTAQIAAACGVRSEWLATGAGDMIDTSVMPADVAQLVTGISELRGYQREWMMLSAVESLVLAKRLPVVEPTESSKKQNVVAQDVSSKRQRSK